MPSAPALIGITNNPSIYDPYINADKNKERQVIILDQMLEQKYITQEQHDTAVAEELVLHNASGEASGDEDYYSYFEDQVINDVVRDLREKTGYDQTIVRKMLMTAGYKIYSTLTPMCRRQWRRFIRTLTTPQDRKLAAAAIWHCYH